MSTQLDVKQIEQKIGDQFADLKATLKEIAKEETRGHVDVLLTEKLERINDAITKADEKLEQAEKALSLSKARREVGESLESDELKAAWLSFIRKNSDDLSPEHKKIMRDYSAKNMNSGSDFAGGYLVIPYFDQLITARLYETSPIRQLATIKLINTDQYEKNVRLDEASCYWQDRDNDFVESAAPDYGRLTIRVQKLVANPRVSQDLLDDAYVNVETELLDSIVGAMERREATAFVAGSGVGEPTGFLSGYPIVSTVNNWGQIQYVPSGDAAKITTDAITDLIYAMKDTTGGSFLMNRLTIAAVRKLKDTLGNALWTPQFGSEPATICGFPVNRAADMPNVVAGAYPIAFADFREAYYIIDRMGTRILRNPYTDTPFVKFTTTRRVGGGVHNFDEIKLMKIGTT